MAPPIKADHLAIAIGIRDGMRPKFAAEVFGYAMSSIWRIMRNYGVKAAPMWSQDFDCCQNPDCPHTVGGDTSKPHGGHGLCRACRQIDRYRKDPVYRAKVRARASGRTSDGAKPPKWKQRIYRKRYEGLRRAAGFRQEVQTGMDVAVPWHHDYYGKPRPLRIVRRYAREGEAVADLDDGEAVFKAVPLMSMELWKMSTNTQ